MARRGGLLLLLLGPLIGGCADERDPNADVVLRVANWTSPANVGAFLTQERTLREEFAAQHPGLARVALEQIPGHGNYTPKLLMRHIAGDVPDVMHLDASYAAIFIDNDALLDLRPFIEADPDVQLSDYFAHLVRIGQRDQAVYAIPLDFTPMVVFYNKRLFDEAGVAYPREGWTWAEFLATARALTIHDADGHIRQYGVNFVNVMPFWIMWLWNNGGDVLDPQTHRAAGALDSPASVAALQFLVDLLLRERVAPRARDTAAIGLDLFRSEQAAMDVKGHWMIVDYRSDHLDFGVVGLPTNVGASHTVVYASSLAIMARSRHPDLAWQYIKFMTSTPVQIRRLAGGLAISGNRAAAAHYADNPIEQAFLAQVPRARPPWGAFVERFPLVEELGREMLEDVLYTDGAIPVAAAAARAARLIDAELE